MNPRDQLPLPLPAVSVEVIDCRPAPFQRHSPTSKQAAADIEPKAGTLRALILDYLRRIAPAGATEEQIQTRLKLYVRNSPTSKQAAADIEPKAGTLRAIVLAAIRGSGAGGSTDHELQQACAMDGSTERPRRVELERAGLIRDSGRRRPTKTRRLAVVWVAVE